MLEKDFTHSDVLTLWKGSRYLSKASRDIGIPKSRYRRWLAQNNVPPRYWPQLITAVRRQFGLKLTTDQLTAAVVRVASSKQTRESMEAR